MEVDYKKRAKVELKIIKICQLFKMVDSDVFYMRVDLSKEVVFKELLREEAVYCINLATGELAIFESNMIVHSFSAKVVEL